MHIYDVIVVGAGSTGAQAVHHLLQSGASNILVLEMGKVGLGKEADHVVLDDTVLKEGEEKVYKPFNSGTAVFEGGSRGPSTIKMIIGLPPYG
jgi:thioredoxin reductase